MEDPVRRRGALSSSSRPKIDRRHAAANASNALDRKTKALNELDFIQHGIDVLISYLRSRPRTTMNELLKEHAISGKFRSNVSDALAAKGIRGKIETIVKRGESIGKEKVFYSDALDATSDEVEED